MYWFSLLVALVIIGLLAYKNINILKELEKPKDLELKNMRSAEGEL